MLPGVRNERINSNGKIYAVTVSRLLEIPS
mgnify:CR=1 FL=1